MVLYRAVGLHNHPIQTMCLYISIFKAVPILQWSTRTVIDNHRHKLTSSKRSNIS